MRFGEKLLKKIAEEQIERQNIQRSGRREVLPNLFAIDEQLNLYFLFEKLKNYCAYLNYKKIISSDLLYKQEMELEMMTWVIPFLDKQKHLPTLIEIYHKISSLYLALDKEKNQSQSELLTLSEIEQLIEIKKEMDSLDLIEIYSNLTNYCTYQINHGNNIFLIKNLKYNRKLLELEFNENGVINSGAYKNFVTLILKASDECSTAQIQQYLSAQQGNLSEWAMEFVEKYKNRLEAVDRDKYYQYSKALIYFYKKEHLKAFDALKELTRVRELFVSLDVKMLQLQVFLELDIELEEIFEASGIQIEKVLESFRKQIGEEKKSPKMNYHFRYYEDFYKVYAKFYAFFKKHAWEHKGGISYDNKLKRLEALIEGLSYAYKKWFVEKLGDIKK